MNKIRIMAGISSQRAEKIAKNINAMDTAYQYSDNLKNVRFFGNLEKTLRRKLSELTEEDKNVIAKLCSEIEANFFGIKK